MIVFQEELLTIPSDLSLINLEKDPFYRYKMPELKVKYDKKYTVLSNLSKVSQSLFTSPDYILQNFSQRLKTQGQKSIFKKREQFKIKGFHEKQNLQKILDHFIIEYLICSNCKYPELRYYKKTKKLNASCNSCGQLIVHEPSKSKTSQYMHNNPQKKTEQELFEQEEDRIYGNRKIEFET